MVKIRIGRAAYYNLFIDEFERQGAPVESWLEASGMPVLMREQPDIYISSLPFLHFLIQAEYKFGDDDMSGNAIRSMQTSTFSAPTRVAVAGASTLYRAICSIIELSRLESSEQHYWIDLSHPNLLRVRSNASLARNAYHPNLLQNWGIIRIVRDYLGNRWTPPDIGFQSSAPPGGLLYDDLHDTQFFANQPSAWVSIPKTDLWVPHPQKSETDVTEILEYDQPALQLPQVLRKLLKTDLRAGNKISVAAVAESTGTSVRSLQRALKNNSCSFRKVLDEAKCDLALEHLKMPENSITDVAVDLGYSDASHFSRMFLRHTGMSPREFRRRQE